MRLFVEELSPVPEPVLCCERLAGWPYRLFLDSAIRGPRLGRYSFVMADPVAIVRSKGTRTDWIEMPRATDAGEAASAPAIPLRSHAGADTDPLAVVRARLAPFRTAPHEGLPPFQGGAAGYLAYDWGLALERLPTPRYDDLALPDALFGIYDWVLAWDHVTGRAWLISTGMPEDGEARRVARARTRAAAVRERLQCPAPASPAPAAGAHAVAPVAPSFPVEHRWWNPALGLRSSFTREAYLDAVARVREYILAGDIFQANLSQRFEAPLREAPWSFYQRLRVRNAAPFAAFMELPGAEILSASPERFLRVDPAGHVETRPIKGTRPRGMGPEHDAALGQALTESAKDRAENLMIVDLMRNDLSRVCAPGTVRVPELFALERYATVHHLVSTVVGILAPGADALDLVRAAFPGGSITGAPKLRAMEIIAELEPSRRGVYCGSLGYWSLTGDLDTNIAIRTAVTREGRIYFSAGGGIVADSEPVQEYQETLDKARGLIDALAPPV